MKSHELGKNTSEVEVTNVSRLGLWVLLRDKEYFLPYQDFPWFRDARLSAILEVELLHGFHLHWPKLDVDLDLAALERPQEFPLVSSGKATARRP
ncbi:MAG: DUF2442 domain-containing protein [Thermoguttaceae bacterium]